MNEEIYTLIFLREETKKKLFERGAKVRLEGTLSRRVDVEAQKTIRYYSNNQYYPRPPLAR